MFWGLTLTIWCWVFVVLIFIALVALVDHEQWGWGAFWLTASILILYLVFKIPVFSWPYHHPLKFGGSFIGYLACGILTAIYLWWALVRDQVFIYKHIYLPFKTKYPKESDPITDPYASGTWRSFFAEQDLDQLSHKTFEPNPKPGDHRSSIYGWILFWPWALLDDLLTNTIVRLARSIYNQIAGILQKISDKAFAEFKTPQK